MVGFSGVWVPALTPFGRDLAPDAARLGRYCRWLLDRGANGLALFGTTSEANSLSLGERRSLLESVIDSGVPADRLMPGTGLCSLPETVELTRHAVKAGCGGVLMLPPFYYKGVGANGLFASYAEVIERVAEADLRIALYHFPAMSGVPITLDLVERLIKAYPETVVGLKDSSGEIENTLALLKRFPGFSVFPGSEKLLLKALGHGAAGCISATANVNVGAIRRLIDSYPGPAAEELHRAVSALREAIEVVAMVPALKALIAHFSGDADWGIVRPPLAALGAGAAAELIAKATEAGLDLDGLDLAIGLG